MFFDLLNFFFRIWTTFEITFYIINVSLIFLTFSFSALFSFSNDDAVCCKICRESNCVLFELPSAEEPILRKTWLTLLELNENTHSDIVAVCCSHFEPFDCLDTGIKVTACPALSHNTKKRICHHIGCTVTNKFIGVRFFTQRNWQKMRRIDFCQHCNTKTGGDLVGRKSFEDLWLIDF